MRKALIVGGLIVTALYAYLALVGIEPEDRRPGTRISGTPVTLPADLQFADRLTEVVLETRPWYGIPFSVTTVIVRHDGHLYIPSLYDTPQAFPGTKYWNQVVANRPQVRLRADGSLYELRIDPVLDQAEFEAVFTALGRKFPFWREQIEMDGRLPRFALLKLSARRS